MTVREDGLPGLQPTSDEVHRQLEAVSSSRLFTSSPRLSAFLRYIVERALDGTTDGVKEYSIGIDVFDRNADFDPRTDTIVRVHAGRLRKRLAEYYSTNGAADPVVIEVPKGGYIPTFRRRTGFDPQAKLPPSLQSNDVGAEENGESPSQTLLSKALAAVLGIALLGLLFAQLTAPEPEKPVRRFSYALEGITSVDPADVMPE